MIGLAQNYINCNPEEDKNSKVKLIVVKVTDDLPVWWHHTSHGATFANCLSGIAR